MIAKNQVDYVTNEFYLSNKLEKSEDDEDKEYEKINLLQLINFMKSAWLTADSTFILNCFRRAFFKPKLQLKLNLIIKNGKN